MRIGIFVVAFATIFLSACTSVQSSTLCSTSGVRSENVNFVQPRMSQLLASIPSDITSLRAILDNELNATPRFKAAWDEAITIFQQRKADLVNIGFEWVPEEYHIALIAYTLSQTPSYNDAFYYDFNKLSRELCTKPVNCTSPVLCEDQLAAFPYRSEFKLLELAIEALSLDPQFHNSKPAYFRGASFGFALCEGQIIEFQSFTSTSTNKAKAVEYSKNVTVFEFNGPVMPKSIYLRYHSGFPDEEEVLVSPLVTYKVEKVDMYSNAYTTHVLTPIQIFFQTL